MKLPLLSIATLVLGVFVGLGVDLRGTTGKNPPETTKQENPRVQQKAGERVQPAADAVLSDFLSGRSASEISPEEARQLLMPMFRRHLYDTTRDTSREGVLMEYQMRLLMAKLPLPVLEQTLELARDGSTPFFRTHEAFAAYAIRDWDRAMEWAGKQRDKADLKAAALSWLAETEPDRATQIYQQAILDGVVQYDGVTLGKLARHHARRGPDAYLDFLDGLPSLEDNQQVLRAVNDLPPEELPVFLKAYVHRRMEGKLGGTGYLFTDILSHPPERVEEIMKALREMQEDPAPGVSSGTLADTSDAFERAGLMENPEEQATYLVEAIGKLSQDEKLTSADIETLKDRLDGSGLTGGHAERVKEAIEKLSERFSKPPSAK